MKTKVKLILSMAIVLLMAGMFASCKKDDAAAPVVKTGLSVEIAVANALIASSTEGVGGGQFLKGSKATLQTAIDAANAVFNNAAATQAAVTSATVNLTAAVTTFNAQVVTPIDPTNLVGQWTFDEITATAEGTVVKDYSGNSRNGTVKTGNAFFGAGNITLAADRYGIAGKAIHFDKGSNVEIPYNTALNPANMSISLWAKADVNSPIHNDNYMIAMNRWNGYKLNFQSDPKAFFTVHATDGANSPIYDRDNASPLVTQGTWWHIVVTFGGGHMVFYLNGIAVKDWDNTPGTAFSLSAAPVNLVFGQDLPTSGYSNNSADPNYLNYGGFYIGTLDEVRMYKSVLTASQVTSIYTVEKP